MLMNVVRQEKMSPRIYENHTVQKRLLGEFYKEDITLPIVENGGTSAYEETIDMKLFGYLENVNTTFINKWRQKEILRNVVYIGVTGAGKTYQIQKHSLSGFVLYTTAADMVGEVDHYMLALKSILKDTDDVTAPRVVLFWITVKLAFVLPTCH
jgi:hypothetical protein